MHLYGTQKINDSGTLEIGQVDTIKLAKLYGTPLFVYDTALIRERARAFIQTFEKANVKAEVAFASKAFSSIAMYQLAAEEKLSLD
ncbi:MAG: diaminopimelate decarboxylase, partial [Paenisporosarcina sp.]